MGNQLTSNAEALRLFFTEDVYLVKGEQQTAFVAPVNLAVEQVLPINESMPVLEKPVAETTPAALPVAAQIEPTLKKEWNFEFLGKNQKQILILVNDKTNKVSSPQGTELLRKLVKAIELTNNDFALVNYAAYEAATYAELHSFFSCRLVLSFGVAFEQLGLTAKPLHQLFEHEKTRMVFTKNLHELDSDQSSKKLLWTTLQQLK